MKQNFDILNRYKFPKIKLCKPSKIGQCYISGFRELKIKKVFNGLDECTFAVERYIDSADSPELKVNPCYNSILTGKLLYLDEYGWFIIDSFEIHTEGLSEYKDVKAVSYEFVLSQNELYGLTSLQNQYTDSSNNGTIRLFNPITPLDEKSILGKFVSSNPLWSIGEVSSDLMEEYRTFDISSANWYDFLMNTAEEAFECIFTFDTINMRINAYTPKDIIQRTNIYVSNKNLIDKIDINPNGDELYNAMDCFGGNGLSISGVNPLGTNTIYNFSWMLRDWEEWMTIELRDAIMAWSNKYNSLVGDVDTPNTYANIMLQYRELISQKVTKSTELEEAKTKMKAAEQAVALYIGTGEDTDPDHEQHYKELVAKLEQEKANVSTVESELSTIESQLNSAKLKLENITKEISFENNFTPELYNELMSIIKKTSYQSDAFSVSSISDDKKVLKEQQKLYDHCVKTLQRVSSPRASVKCDMSNFVFLPEYEFITKEFDVGKEITVEIRKGWREKLYCLSFELDFDNPEDMSIEFGNRFRESGEVDKYSDLFNNTIKSANSFGWLKNTIMDSDRTGLNGEVRDFINSNFDAAKNEIETANGVKMSVSGSGVRIQRDEPDGNLSPYELRLLNSGIFLSEDNFNTEPKTAIGRFKVPDTNTYMYGVNAELLASKISISENLYIDTGGDNPKFRVDKNGVVINDGKFNVESGNTRVTIDPKNANGVFALSGRESSTASYVDKLYIDNNGNLSINNAKIEVSDSVSNNSVLIDPSGDNIFSIKHGAESKLYIDNIGDLHVSGDISGSTGTFLGTITGGEININGQFIVDEFGNLTANKGTFLGDIRCDKITNSSGTSYITEGGDKIQSDYLDLKGLTIRDSQDNITFEVRSSGDVYIRSGKIFWDNVLESGNSNAQITADDALSKANDASSAVDDWTYTGTTEIDGNKIATGTITADNIRGKVVSLYSKENRSCGTLTITDASTGNYALELLSNEALRLTANSGSLYLESYNNFINITDSDGISIGASGSTGGNMYRLVPASSRDYLLGDSNRLWLDIFSESGTINTSDRTLKKDIEYNMNKYKELFLDLKPTQYKFIKNQSNRYHLGFISQDVEDSMLKLGLTSNDFAGFIKSPNKDENGNIIEGYSYGLRYSEFIALNTYMIQELYKRVEELEKGKNK